MILFYKKCAARCLSAVYLGFSKEEKEKEKKKNDNSQKEYFSMEFIMCVKMLKLSRHDKSGEENKIE